VGHPINASKNELGRVDPSSFKLPYRHRLQPHTPQLIRRNPPAEPLEHRFNAAQLDEHTADIEQQHLDAGRRTLDLHLRPLQG
jgi:hypothetical protein